MAGRAPTPSQTVGPFFGFALPFAGGPQAGDAAPGEAVRIEGRLLDGAGEPVPDGLLEVWLGDRFARCPTDPEGAFHFTVPKPAPGPPRGERRGAPHLEVAVFGRGLLRHLVTRLYFPDEAAANAADPVLETVPEARRQTLVAQAEPGALRFDIRLQGEQETVFFAL